MSSQPAKYNRTADPIIEKYVGLCLVQLTVKAYVQLGSWPVVFPFLK